MQGNHKADMMSHVQPEDKEKIGIQKSRKKERDEIKLIGSENRKMTKVQFLEALKQLYFYIFCKVFGKKIKRQNVIKKVSCFIDYVPSSSGVDCKFRKKVKV
jgi:hypothetical protein